jgi:hypothetical protein
MREKRKREREREREGEKKEREICSGAVHSYLKTSTPFIMMNLLDHIESIWIIFRFKFENKIQFACIILLMISSSDILISFRGMILI